MINKLSLNITEDEYRKLQCVSYSMLSSYKNDGVKGLIDFINRKPFFSNSFVMGSLIDMMITEPDKLEDNFTICDNPPSLKAQWIFKQMLKNEKELIDLIKEVDYCNSNWKDKTRIDKYINEMCDFNFTQPSNFISQQQFDTANNAVQCLKNNPKFDFIFKKKEEVGIYFQQKFITELNNVPCKCMTDIISINYNRKIVQIFDLKTMSNPEYMFELNYLSYNYQIQAHLYRMIVKDVLSKDEYFKDFKVQPLRFIVVSLNEPQPTLCSYDITTDERNRINDLIDKVWQAVKCISN